jgi:hypothetical protein
VPFQQATGARQCAREAEFQLGRWAAERPEWQIRRWTCGVPKA